MPRRSTRSAAPAQHDVDVDEQENVPRHHDSVQDADQHMHSTDEEDQPVARSKKSNATKSKSRTAKVKAERNKRPHAHPIASTAEGSNNDAPAAQFDRDGFLATARPIPQEGAKPIDGVIADLQNVLHQLEHTGFGLVLDTAVAVEEASGKTDERQEAAIELDLVMRQLVDAQQELKTHQKSLDTLKQRIIRGEVMGNLETLYTTNVSDTMRAYGSRTSRQKYAKHKDYFRFRERVWEVNNDDAMPPLGDIIPREDGDSDAESDIEIGGMTQDYKCPISLAPLTNPLTSRLCGHSFSADAIREYIAAGRGRTQCAATGCHQVLTQDDLEPDEELATRAANAARRAKRREEESDESQEEVVE